MRVRDWFEALVVGRHILIGVRGILCAGLDGLDKSD
jgi:hypothetical protein